MNLYINQTDRYLLLTYYFFAIFVGYNLERFGDENLVKVVFDLAIYVILSFGLFWVIVTKIFPWYLPTGQFIHLLVTLILAFLLFGLIELFLADLWTYLECGKISLFNKPVDFIVFNALLQSFINVCILLVLYIGKRYFETQLTLKSEEQKSKELQFKALKTQMDPHFLFNNLNSIESLIEDAPDKAIIYVQKLSKLYRYFLNTNNEEVVLVEKEINFAKDYIYLTNARFGNLYEFKFINFNHKVDKLIPPGALQCVIENVIKHNIVKEHESLLTTITLNESNVVVKNTKNLKKSSKNRLNGTGLANLQDRYKLLGDFSIEIQDLEQHFIVNLPLINVIKE